MPRTPLLYANFSAGELSPEMRGRTDFPRYQRGAQLIRNGVVLLQGGIEKRRGTRYVATAHDATRAVRLAPFIFRSVDALVLEWGHQSLRFYKNGTLLGAPYVLPTPYTASPNHVFDLRLAQKNDVVYLTHQGYAPRKLSRLGDTNWILNTVNAYPPPTSEEGYAPAIGLTLGAVTGTGVSVTAGSAAFLDADVDRVLTSGVGRGILKTVTSPTTATLDILDDFSSTVLAASEWVLAGSPVANVSPSKTGPLGGEVVLTLHPTNASNLVLNGGFNDTTDWTDLDTGTGTSTIAGGMLTLNGGAVGSAIREQQVTGLTTGLSYNVTATIGTRAVVVQVGTITGGQDLFSAVFVNPGQLSIDFTATGTDAFLQFLNAVNGDATVDDVQLRQTVISGWRPSDVGKWVYLHEGLVKITAYTDGQHVTGQIVATLESDEEAPAGAWSLEEDVWTVAHGYPLGAVFHESRLVYFSSPQFPQTVWGSVSDDFENFARGVNADDSFSYTIAKAQGLLYWALSSEQLLIGAENGEFRMVGPSDGPIVASSPPIVRPVGTYGTAALEPLEVGVSVLFGQRKGSALRELTFQAATLTSANRDLSSLSGHFLADQHIVQMAQVKEPMPLLWLVLDNGTLAGITYDREEQVVAWHRHELGGGGVVESVAVIPHPTMQADQTWLVVRRELEAGPNRFIEVIDDTAVGVDAAVVYDGAPIATLAGLDHLEGETVRIAGIPSAGTLWAVLDDQTVTGGAVPLMASSTSLECSQVYAGLPWALTVQTLSPEVPNAPTIQRQRKRWQDAFISVLETGEGLLVNGERVDFALAGRQMDDGLPFVTGDYDLRLLGWSREAVMEVVHSQPLPCTVLIMGGALEVGDN